MILQALSSVCGFTPGMAQPLLSMLCHENKLIPLPENSAARGGHLRDGAGLQP